MDLSPYDLRKEIGEYSLTFFCEFYLKNHFGNGLAEFQESWISDIEQSNKVAIVAPRRHGKTTFMLGFVLWNILYKKSRYILLISETDMQSKILLEAIVHELERNEEILADFGNITGFAPKKAEEKEKWTGSEIITTTQVKVQAISTKSKVRGLKYLEFRPNLIILDDIESDEGVRSAMQRELLEAKILRAILNLGDENSKYIIIGTLLHKDSLLNHIVGGQLKGWTSRVYKAIVNDTPLWKERYSLNYLNQLKEEIGSRAFSQEFMNEPIDYEARLYSELHLTNQTLETFLPENIADSAIYFDLAISEKQTADETSYTYGIRDRTGKIYILKNDAVKKTGQALFDYVVNSFNLLKPFKVGIESNQFQKFFQQMIANPALTQGVNIPAIGVSNTQDKVTRFLKIVPFIENGTVQFAQNLLSLVDQMDEFPNGLHDDRVDSMIGVVEMLLVNKPIVMELV